MKPDRSTDFDFENQNDTLDSYINAKVKLVYIK